MKCDIIICIWNQRDITRECIESIYQHTRYPYRLILIDNASDTDTKEYCESVKEDGRFEVTLIRNEENVGNTKAVNQGLRASTSPYICNLDNDTYVTDGWLAEMVKVAESDSSIGIVGPGFPKKSPPADAPLKYVNQLAEEYAKYRGEYRELATLDCFCALIVRKVVEKIGLWDEAYSPGYFDDTDYCRRAVKEGFKVVRARGAFVYHREHGSFRKSQRREELFQRNKKIYLERYGESRRLLFIVNRKARVHYGKIQEMAYKAARDAHQVRIYRDKDLPPMQEPVHGSIESDAISGFLFGIMTLWRVLTKKKKFDQIYVSDPSIKSMLDRFQKIHKTKVELI